MDRLPQLPKINLSDLEKKIIARHNSSPFHSTNVQGNRNGGGLAEEIHVTSPFYEKIKHGNKCECPYHRMKKYHEKGVKIKPTQKQVFIININPCSMVKHNEQYLLSTSMVANRKPEVSSNSKSVTKLLRPLERNTCHYKGSKQNSCSSSEKQVQVEKFTKNDAKKSYLDWSNCTANDLRDSFGDVRYKINDNNEEYMNFLSKRLQNEKYKEKYIRTLFKFIKMKTKKDRLYMWDSKAYIENSINVLLNHFSISALASWESLTPENVQKVAYHMSCAKEKVPKILSDLKSAVHEMEEYIEQIRRQKQTQKQFSASLSTYKFDKLYDSEQDKFSRSYLTNQKFSDISDRQNDSINCIGDGEHLRTVKDTTKSFRKSARQMDFQSTNKLKQQQQLMEEARNNENEDLKQYRVDQLLSGDRSNQSHRSYKRSSTKQNSNKSNQPFQDHSNTRSPRSTFLGTVNERDVESGGQGEVRSMNKKFTKKMKGRKGQYNKKIVVDLQYDAKYKHIPYEQYCSKSEFINMIDQLQRLDKNATQKAQIIYKILKLDRWLQKPKKLEELLITFEPLIDEIHRRQIIKHTVCIRDKKYIEKLTKQMDAILSEIKKTDPRQLDSEDLFPYKMDPTLREPKQIRFTKYKGYGVNRPSFSGNLIDYEADQTIQKMINSSQIQQLEQRQLSNIVSEPIGPNITEQVHYKKIKCEAAPKKNATQSQKKVLQYMHKHHQSTFKYLSSQMSQFCASLPEDHDISYRA